MQSKRTNGVKHQDLAISQLALQVCQRLRTFCSVPPPSVTLPQLRQPQALPRIQMLCPGRGCSASSEHMSRSLLHSDLQKPSVSRGYRRLFV